MKKIKNLVIGGIQNKIFNLVLFTILAIMVIYGIVIVHQSNRLSVIVSETNEKQAASLGSISESTMTSVIESSLSRSTRLEACIADDLFEHLIDEVNLMWDYADKLYADPGIYPDAEVSPPQAYMDGRLYTQLMTEEGVDLNAAAVAADAALIGNMSGLLESLYSSEDQINACFIGTENGIMLISDEVAGTKINDDGSPITFPIRERPWYAGAAGSGETFMTELYADGFTGSLGLTCSRPVYDPSGRLKAVVGADLFLGSMQEAVEGSREGGSFICVINDTGHVVFSPETEGIFKPSDIGSSDDLRNSPDAELAAFVRDAMAGETDVRLVSTSQGEFYMAGAPMESVGWAVISLVAREAAEQPTVTMQERYAEINEAAMERYEHSVKSGRTMILASMMIMTVLAIASALILAGRIVSPINRMAEAARQISGDDPVFKMEDAYRTGDEIEILADSFVELSARTRRYVQDITQITAEKERISTELNVASQIQADMLPSIYPAYPDRDEFDLYAAMDPAREVGGDFFDFFLIDDDHLVLVMADVAGKGVPAALFMVIAKTLIKNRAQMGGSPSEILGYVNDQLCDGNESNMFVTVWMAIVELSTGEVRASNAGHEHPAIRHEGGGFEFVIYRHSPALAVMEGMKFEEHSFTLVPGDSLFVYTDGLCEATNAREELFGGDRAIEALNREPGAEPRRILDNVSAAVNEFVGVAEQFDDLTMLCMTYYGKK